jgi:hypothetical protein
MTHHSSLITASTQSSVLNPQSSVVLLLGALFLFGSDVLLWPFPERRPLAEWGFVLVGCMALAAALLDLAARWRVRGVFGRLALAGLYGLGASLLMHPSVALADIPLNLLNRVLGSQALAGLLMLTLFLELLRGRASLWLYVGSLLAGAMWGILGRWFPPSFNPDLPETPLPVLLVGALIGFVLIAALWVIAARRAQGITAPDMRLSRRARLLVAVALVGLLALRLAQGVIDAVSFGVILSLIAFLVALLWFQKGKRGVSLLEGALPPAPPNPRFLLVALLFVAAGALAYQIPRGEGDGDITGVLGTLFIAFGTVWLPTVSLVLGGRAFLRQVQAQQL